MNIRKCTGVVGLLLALVTVVALAQQERTETAKKVVDSDHDAMMQECAKACSDCQRACETCVTYCAQMLVEGKKEHLAALMACRDCATICRGCAEVCSRGGPFLALVASACARACADCATACEKFPTDTRMKECAQACRNCEQSCLTMSKHTGDR